MLTSLSNLGGVADDVIKNSRENTVQVLNNLQPILANLDAAKNNIVSSLELLPNYPFPTTVKDGVHGDYAGLYASLNLNVNDLVRGLTSNQQGSPATPNLGGLSVPNNSGGAGGLSLPNLNQSQSGGTQQQKSGTGGVLPNVGGLTGQSVGGSDYARLVLSGVGL
jgi:ABC-type transporter Mla subunit MlaD